MYRAIVLAAVTVVLFAAACGGTADELETAASGVTPISSPVASLEGVPTPISYTVVDSNGERVGFEEPPERIVAFDSAAVETLFAIGEGHRVVATHDFVAYPPETAEIPRVGDAFNMNMEAVVALEPDLVFVFSDGSVADLKRTGLKVLYLKSLSDDFRKVADNIRMWGAITGSTEAAEDVAARFEERVAEIGNTMAGLEAGASVFQDVGGLWTPGADTLMAGVFGLLKLDNIARDLSGYAQLSPEVIVAKDPEVIISADPDSIISNGAFKDVRAVKNSRVYQLPSDALEIAGPRFVDGIEELAKLVYSGLFD